MIYLDVLIDDKDQAVVPPLEGFVMNRITEDNFEKLLYKGKSQIHDLNMINIILDVRPDDIETV